MNRRQVFALATTPALGIPSLPIEARPDWRIEQLKFKAKLYREIIDPVYRKAEEAKCKPFEFSGSTDYLWSLIKGCDHFLQMTDAEYEANHIRVLAMVNEGRALRGAPPITEFDC